MADCAGIFLLFSLITIHEFENITPVKAPAPPNPLSRNKTLFSKFVDGLYMDP